MFIVQVNIDIVCNTPFTVCNTPFTVPLTPLKYCILPTPIKMSITEINSFLVSGYFYRLLQKVWTQIRPDRMSVLLWIQNVWHSDSIPELVGKNRFGKRSAEDNKNMENYPVCKEFRHWYLVNSLSSTSWNWKKNQTSGNWLSLTNMSMLF